MNHTAIEAYMHELATFLTTQEEQMKSKAQITATLEMLDSAGRQEQAMQASNQLEEVTQVINSFDVLIAKKTRCRDTEEARKLYMDIAVRLQHVDKLFEDWRRVLSLYELQVATDDFSVEDRAKADGAVTKARVRYETQIELAARLVPSQKIELLS